MGSMSRTPWNFIDFGPSPSVRFEWPMNGMSSVLPSKFCVFECRIRWPFSFVSPNAAIFLRKMFVKVPEAVCDHKSQEFLMRPHSNFEWNNFQFYSGLRTTLAQRAFYWKIDKIKSASVVVHVDTISRIECVGREFAEIWAHSLFEKMPHRTKTVCGCCARRNERKIKLHHWVRRRLISLTYSCLR